MVNIWEKLFFNKRYTATNNKRNPDFWKTAETFGMKGMVCNVDDNLTSKINDFLSYDGPILCQFNCIVEECLPLMAPGKALDDLILYGDNTTIDTSNMLPPS